MKMILMVCLNENFTNSENCLSFAACNNHIVIYINFEKDIYAYFHHAEGHKHQPTLHVNLRGLVVLKSIYLILNSMECITHDRLSQ